MPKPPLRRFVVYSPEFRQGYELVCDAVEVEARTKREAIILGGKEMLREGMWWVHDNRGDGSPPWKGLKAEEEFPDEEELDGPAEDIPWLPLLPTEMNP